MTYSLFTNNLPNEYCKYITFILEVKFMYYNARDYNYDVEKLLKDYLDNGFKIGKGWPEYRAVPIESMEMTMPNGERNNMSGEMPMNNGNMVPDNGQRMPVDNGNMMPDNGQRAPMNNGNMVPDNGQRAPMNNGNMMPDNGQRMPMDNNDMEDTRPRYDSEPGRSEENSNWSEECRGLYENELMYKNDMLLARKLYSVLNQILYPYVELVLGEYEYLGSPIYDEDGIDREMLAQLIDRVLEAANQSMDEIQEIELEMGNEANGSWDRRTVLRSLVESLVIREVFGVRRPRYRSINIRMEDMMD